MTEQLALIQQPPKLTPRQQRALDIVQAAGPDGVHADELGAALHQLRGTHPADQRCRHCGQEGQQMLERLKRDRLVRYVRGRAGVPGYWTAAAADTAAQRPAGMLPDDQELPF